MIGRTKRIGLLFYALALALLSAPHIAAQTVAREELGVRVTAVDATGFPTVRVRVLTTGPGSAPVADTSRLLLRENGVPIPEATVGSASVGVDLVLVIDANVDFLQTDEPGGATRRARRPAPRRKTQPPGAFGSFCQRPNSLPSESLQTANQPMLGTGSASPEVPPSSPTRAFAAFALANYRQRFVAGN